MSTELISITFHTVTGANELASGLEALQAQHLVEVQDFAVVTKYDEQRVVVRHRPTAGPGVLSGALAGTVVGLPAGPAGAVTGFVGGTLIGGAVDATRAPGFQATDLKEMAKHDLGSGESMLLVYADEMWSSSIEGMARRWDAALDPRSAAALPGRENPEGVTIRRRTVEPGHATWDEVLERDRAEVARLRERARTAIQTEREKAQQALATANARLDQKYQSTLDALNGFQHQVEAEIARLETNFKQANADAKAGMEQQLAKAREANQTARTKIKATLAARLDDLKADIESLQAEIAQARGEVSSTWNARVAQLRADGDAERARLKQLDEDLGAAWDATKHDVQGAIDAHRDAVRAAEAHYRETGSERAPGSNESNV